MPLISNSEGKELHISLDILQIFISDHLFFSLAFGLQCEENIQQNINIFFRTDLRTAEHTCFYNSSSASSPPIRCLLLSKTALNDSRSALSCSWNILCLLGSPLFRLAVEFSSSRNGFEFWGSTRGKTNQILSECSNQEELQQRVVWFNEGGYFKICELHSNCECVETIKQWHKMSQTNQVVSSTRSNHQRVCLLCCTY